MKKLRLINKAQYNKGFLSITLKLIMDQLDDLESWSVWNQDAGLEKIMSIKKQIEELKKELL